MQLNKLEPAPIILFVYKRLNNIKITIDRLKKNNLALSSTLIIFSDGPKDEFENCEIENIRIYLKTITGFKTINIFYSSLNNGLAKSIILGVTQVLKNYNSCIVLEDDLITSRNFLNYMNDTLKFYKNDLRVFSIAGYSVPIKSSSQYDVYFTKRSSSWGWATWKDRWVNIDWEVNDYEVFKSDSKKRRAFNQMGSDMCHMLDKQMNGKLNTWAIRWCYHQFKYNLVSVHPFVSKIQNIGFGSDNATNTKEVFNRFETVLDKGERIEFNFSSEIKLDKYIIKQFTKQFTISS